MDRQSGEQNKVRWWRFLSPAHWHTWLGLMLLWLLGQLPLGFIAVLGTVLGELLYMLLASRRKVVIRNLQACFPEMTTMQINRLARKNFRETGKAVTATGIAWWGSKKRLHKLFTLTGEENLEVAKKSGRPLILLVGHSVALEIAGLYLSGIHPIVDIYRRPKNRLLDAVMNNRRHRLGMATLVEFREGLKPVIRLLKKNHWLYYLPDQDFGRKRSIFVPFFGVQTATLPTLARLSKISNALVVPCFVNQLPGARGFEIIFEPALENYPQGDDYKDALTMNQVTENLIRRYPDQYFWLHKRFKTRPEGEPPFYKA